MSGRSASDEGGQHLQPDEAEAVDGAVVDPHELRPDASRLDAVLQQTRYVSPLPPPSDLRQYSELIPDAPERLLAAGEREQAHRHQMADRAATIDEDAVPRFFVGQRRAQILSFLLGVGYEGVMLIAILEGYALEGIVGAAVGIAAMVTAMRRDTAPPTVEQPDVAKHDDAKQQTGAAPEHV